jgi:hypothetical protein
MCFVRISEQTANFPYTRATVIAWVFIIEVESIYCAVHTDSLYKTDYISSLKGLTRAHPLLSIYLAISLTV